MALLTAPPLSAQNKPARPVSGTAGGEEITEHASETISILPPLTQLQVGERVSFQGRWLGIPVGYGWIEVKELAELEGRSVYAVEAQIHSNDFLSTFYPVHDTLRSYLERDSLRPLRFEKYQREGHYRADEIVTFDYGRLIATYRSLLNQSVKEVPILPDVHDLLSAFYWLRTHSFDLTTPRSLDIYSDEKIFHVNFTPQMTLRLELRRRGTFPCVLIEPSANFKGILIRRGRIWFYISADERRLPVYVRIATPWGPMTGVIDQTSLER
ncbi:MAG: DUF3108 domain-containing protein [Candidatus Omnitrophica bacterium]|nr:DUF3108 domain-containing protein [Candidatus Omnitrophota bacterium]